MMIPPNKAHPPDGRHDEMGLYDWRLQKAVERHDIIAPLIRMKESGVPTSEITALRKSLAEQHSLSVRELYRFEVRYRQEGLTGLIPKARNGTSLFDTFPNFENVLNQAIILKRELPSRSTEDIIRILQGEGWVQEGALKRSTLQRYLNNAGFSKETMALYTETTQQNAGRRFCKEHRMELVQGDIKYGPMIPGENGTRVPTYLSSLIDDHSRMILWSEFYTEQTTFVVTDTIRKAIQMYGLFDTCYFDNGGQYIEKHLQFSLAMLGITVRHAPVRSGRSKGKVEKFHQVVDKFIAEKSLEGFTTLEALNQDWAIFLDEYYSRRPHEGIKEFYESHGGIVGPDGISPLQEWNRDTRLLKYPDEDVMASAFLYHEERKVDRGACIQLRGKKYAVKDSLVGRRVQVTFDPRYMDEITVSCADCEPFVAHPLEIKPFVSSSKPGLPIAMQETATRAQDEAETEKVTSRFLNILREQNRETTAFYANAVRFSDVKTDDDGTGEDVK